MAGRVVAGAVQFPKRMQFRRAGDPNSRSQAEAPMPTTQVSSPSGIRNPTDRFSPLTSSSSSRDRPLAAGVDRDRQEDRRLRQGGEDRLGFG